MYGRVMLTLSQGTAEHVHNCCHHKEEGNHGNDQEHNLQGQQEEGGWGQVDRQKLMVVYTDDGLPLVPPKLLGGAGPKHWTVSTIAAIINDKGD